VTAFPDRPTTPSPPHVPIIGYADPKTPPPSTYRPSRYRARPPWPNEVRAIVGLVISFLLGGMLDSIQHGVAAIAILPCLFFVGWYVIARFQRRKRTPKFCRWIMYVATFWCLTWTVGFVLWARSDLVWAYEHESYFIARVLMLVPGIALFAVAECIGFAVVIVQGRRQLRRAIAAAASRASPSAALPDPPAHS
jgi:hypothetical protein